MTRPNIYLLLFYNLIFKIKKNHWFIKQLTKTKQKFNRPNVTLTTGVLTTSSLEVRLVASSPTSMIIREESFGCWRPLANSLICHKKAGKTLFLLALATDKAVKYWRDSWQKNLRNKLENRISVSEPLKDNQSGFSAGDL